MKAETGYIQRRLAKAMEDCKIYYDQTVRNASGAIIQFLYGEDGMDGTKIEKQSVPTIDMNMFQMDAMYHLRPEDNLALYLTEEAMEKIKEEPEWMEMSQKHFESLIEDRVFLIDKVFGGQKNDKIQFPIPFERILKTAQQRIHAMGCHGVPTDLTPGHILKTMEMLKEKLFILRPNQGVRFIHILLNIYLAPKPLITQYHMPKVVFDWVVSQIERYYVESVAQAGEMVGIVAAQSLGELNTQLSTSRDTRIRVVSDKGNFTGDIGDFIDKLIAENPEKVVDLGHGSVVMDLEDDYNIVGVSTTEKTSWRRIKQISRHPANGGMVKVYTETGRTTCATLSHSFLKRTQIGIAPILGSDLKVGDRIPVARNIPIVKDATTTVQIGDKTYALDRQFGWILGAYLADGSINANSIRITKVEQTFEDNIRLFGERYDLPVKFVSTERPNKWGDAGKKETYITKENCLYAPELAKWIKENFKSGSYNKHVPGWVYGCTQEFIAGLIAGYFDGDGNINVPRQLIRAHSVNEGLIDDILVLLAQCGIFAKKQYEKKKRTVSSEYWIAQVQHKYAEVFRDLIQLTVPYKRDGVVELCKYNSTKTYKADHIDLIPEVDDLLDMVGRKLQMPEQSRMYGKYKRLGMNRISRSALDKYTHLFRESLEDKKMALDTKTYDEVSRAILLMEQAAKSDVVWDKIVKLEYLEDPQELVYDFTVPGNDSFMVDAGVLVHNTLDSFHSSGTAAAVKATSGVPRLKELLSVSKNIKTPTMLIYLKDDVSSVRNPEEDDEGNVTDPRVQEAKGHSMQILHKLETTRLIDLLDSTEIYWDPPGATGLETGIEEDDKMLEVYRAFSEVHRCKSTSPWVLRMKINREKMHRLGLTMMDIHLRIQAAYATQVECLYNDDNAPQLVLRIRLTKEALKDVDSEDTIAALKAMEHNLIHQVLLKGMRGIKKVSMRLKTRDERNPTSDEYNQMDDRFDKIAEWMLDTDGTNLIEILADPNIDAARTRSNDVWEIYRTLGIEAARNALYQEFGEVLGEDALNYRHMSLLLDTMTSRGTLMSVDRHGINRGDGGVGPLAKSSFEETTDMLINASIFSEHDRINGVSANIMLGQLPPCGTGDHEVLLDEDAYVSIMKERNVKPPSDQELEKRFADEARLQEACSVDVIAMPYKISTKQKKTLQKPVVTFG